MIYRIFVEKKENLQAKKTRADLDAQLGIAVEDFREILRYDVEGLSQEELKEAIVNVFSEPPVDNVYLENMDCGEDYKVFAVSYLNGQYDQRADSAAQCVQLLTRKARPLVRCARVYAVRGVTDAELARIKNISSTPWRAKKFPSTSPKRCAAPKCRRRTSRRSRALST